MLSLIENKGFIQKCPLFFLLSKKGRSLFNNYITYTHAQNRTSELNEKLWDCSALIPRIAELRGIFTAPKDAHTPFYTKLVHAHSVLFWCPNMFQAFLYLAIFTLYIYCVRPKASSKADGIWRPPPCTSPFCTVSFHSLQPNPIYSLFVS